MRKASEVEKKEKPYKKSYLYETGSNPQQIFMFWIQPLVSFQERKGARKEIRADNAFLATQRAKLARAKDVDRQEKTKAIFSGLASQEGDYKKLLKKKKKF